MFIGCDEFGIRREISRFFCPIATTMKADGPAVFISSACIFLAQMEMTNVPASTVVVIWYVSYRNLQKMTSVVFSIIRNTLYLITGY